MTNNQTQQVKATRVPSSNKPVIVANYKGKQGLTVGRQPLIVEWTE